jgi:antitoxin (DNA-binding transcriptional repressor) of toxin-antitoxin stability system
MKTMTATQAARNFAALLNEVEHGEDIVITRDGVPVGRFTAERLTAAERLKFALRTHPADPAFADDLDLVRADLQTFLPDKVHAWPEG